MPTHTPKPKSRKAIDGDRRRKRNYKQRLRERQLTALLTDGLEGMSDVKWEETKNAILFGMAQAPGPNAQNQLKAIEMIERKRQEQKFGSRDAVEATKARCEKRLAELALLGQWGQVNGVQVPRELMGHSGAHREAGETSAGQDGTLEKTGVA